jgi:hypothetical protein
MNFVNTPSRAIKNSDNGDGGRGFQTCAHNGRYGENVFHRPPEDVVVIPGPDPLKTGLRQCVSCHGDFLRTRPWSRFCSPACRLRAHRKLAGQTTSQRSAAIPAGGPP